MQEFSVAFGRVSRATFSANPELRSHVTELVNRAYFNLRGMNITSADNAWANAITAAAMQLCLDPRTGSLPTRELIQVFETIIRVSEEHMAEAKRHAAMANNVFYLKETALDAALHGMGDDINTAASTILGQAMAHTGRVQTKKTESAA